MKIVQKGFTLIELLIVIAILGVLAAAVVTAINPVKKIKQANDAKIKNDIGQIATAMQAYYTLNASYPAELSTLETAQELKKLPVAPTGSAYNLAISPAGCTTAAKTCTEVRISAVLLDPAVATNVWCWRTSTQTTVEVLPAACTAP